MRVCVYVRTITAFGSIHFPLCRRTLYALFAWWIFIDEWTLIDKSKAKTYVEILYLSDRCNFSCQTRAVAAWCSSWPWWDQGPPIRAPWWEGPCCCPPSSPPAFAAPVTCRITANSSSSTASDPSYLCRKTMRPAARNGWVVSYLYSKIWALE